MRNPAVLVASALLLVTGCSAGAATSSESGGPATSGVGEQVDLDFTAETLDGATLEGSDLEGQPAVLWFWAPWCPTCRAQAPNVSALAEQYEGEVAVIGVGGLDDTTAIADLAEEIPHVTHVVDPDGEVWQHFGVTAQSTYTVVDADGEVVNDEYLEDAELNDLVARLATEAP